MQGSRFKMAVLFPILSVLVIAGYAGGLGVLFIVLDETLSKWAVVVLGTALVVAVPGIAALLESRLQD